MLQQKLRKQINLTITLQVLCCYSEPRTGERTCLQRPRKSCQQHLNSCYDTNYLGSKTNNELTDFVMTYSKIIDSSNNCNLLLYKEALHIKRCKSILNNGLKASRELQLFN